MLHWLSSLTSSPKMPLRGIWPSNDGYHKLAIGFLPSQKNRYTKWSLITANVSRANQIIEGVCKTKSRPCKDWANCQQKSSLNMCVHFRRPGDLSGNVSQTTSNDYISAQEGGCKKPRMNPMQRRMTCENHVRIWMPNTVRARTRGKNLPRTGDEEWPMRMHGGKVLARRTSAGLMRSKRRIWTWFLFIRSALREANGRTNPKNLVFNEKATWLYIQEFTRPLCRVPLKSWKY